MSHLNRVKKKGVGTSPTGSSKKINDHDFTERDYGNIKCRGLGKS